MNEFASGQHIGMKLLFLGLAMFGSVASVLADPRDFKVDASPVFQSSASWNSMPIHVSIENRGPDARGNLILMDSAGSTRYPVELPTGSKKRITAFPSNSQYGFAPEIWLDTNQGRFEIPFTTKGSYTYGGSTAVLISDDFGELGFLRQVQQRRQNEALNTITDAYVKPEDAPDRPVGYQGINTVMLGAGSQRLSDSAVGALHSYALTGGTLVFVGGASATVLGDARWQGILPGTNFRTTTIADPRSLSKMGGSEIGDSITVAAGTPKPGTNSEEDSGIPIIMESSYGLGRVVVLAFNPFEEPLSRWSGRRRVLQLFIRPVELQRAAQYLAQYGATSSGNYDPYGSNPGSTIYPGSYSQSSSDPFSVQLPPATKVFWILAGFFVAVVPLNFLILRKLGRGELAWVTAPIISLVFAGAFLNQASDLYSASLSTATTGVLIAQQGANEAMFVGTTQMFFPSGGTYDLRVENIDQLSSGINEYMGRDASRTQVNPVDVGTIRIPDMRASNLAFEELDYRQRYASYPKLDLQIQPARLGNIRITVANRSNGTLRNCSVLVAGRRYGLKELVPGQSQSVEVQRTGSGNAQGDTIGSITSRHQTVALEADYSGLRPGPQIGANVANRSSIRLVYFARIGSGSN